MWRLTLFFVCLGKTDVGKKSSYPANLQGPSAQGLYVQHDQTLQGAVLTNFIIKSHKKKEQDHP